MTFTFPALAVAGALLALVPIVIHLLNRRRRRRVAWGAMDFLLQSDRKNRTWVRLSEWLLLATRVLAVALAGVLAARPELGGELSGLLGEGAARHVVVLDDTASMQRLSGGTTAGEEAQAALGRLIDRARRRGDEVVVLRYTDHLTGAAAWRLSQAGPAAIGAASWETTFAAAPCGPALESAVDLVNESAAGSKTLVYVLSDFAESSHGDLTEGLAPLRDAADEVVLAACGDPPTPNLAVERVRLAPGPLAAGVESRVAITLVNHSDVSVPASSLTLRRGADTLTAIRVASLEPRERREIETLVAMPDAALQVIEARVDADRFGADDAAWLAVEPPAAQSVLLIGDPLGGAEATVFSAALAPRGSTRTGWLAESAARLTEEALAGVCAVVVLDTDIASEQAAQALRTFVERGGGVLLVLGPRCDPDCFNQRLATAGVGEAPLVPWRLGPVVSVPVAEPGQSPLEVADHPAVRTLGEGGKGLLPLVSLIAQRRMLEEEGGGMRRVTAGGPVALQTLLQRSDGEPLLVASQYGRGRVAALLTTVTSGAASDSEGGQPWSNLAGLPLFPVMVQDLVGWLVGGKLNPPCESIGDTAPSAAGRQALERIDLMGESTPATPLGPAAPLAPAAPGVYRRLDGGNASAPFAALVGAGESDLRASTPDELRSRTRNVARVGRAEELFLDDERVASREPLEALALLLLVLLCIERWLAFRTSYVEATAGGTP